MKRVFGFVMAVVMVFSMVGCGNEKNVKLGLGVYSYIEETADADADNMGKAEVVSTAAAVLLDQDGKIVACDLDVLDATAEFDSKGQYIASASGYQTKGEQGSNYGMVAYGGASKEWYEQADAFEAVVAGKTIEEVKALLADDQYSGNEEVIKAGCTIGVSDFINALEKAVANAEDSSATDKASLKLGIVTSQSGSDAAEEADGSNELEITYAAVAADQDGKVVAAAVDTLDAKATFDTKGAYTGSTGEMTTKGMMGENYGMAAYGTDLNGDGEVKEWFEQANAFEAACIGKTAAEITALESDGYGVEDVQKAGCTIGVSGFVSAIVKAIG